jgi:hypothetical protein
LTNRESAEAQKLAALPAEVVEAVKEGKKTRLIDAEFQFYEVRRGGGRGWRGEAGEGVMTDSC